MWGRTGGRFTPEEVDGFGPAGAARIVCASPRCAASADAQDMTQYNVNVQAAIDRGARESVERTFRAH